MSREPLPSWAVECVRRYEGGHACIFVLHGNVYDDILTHDGRFVDIPGFVESTLFRRRQVTDVSPNGKGNQESVFHSSAPKSQAIVCRHAEVKYPAAPANMLSEEDRGNVLQLHDEALSGSFRRDGVAILITDDLTQVNQKLVRHPATEVIKVGLPDESERAAVIRSSITDERLASHVDKLAARTAGLQVAQIRTLVALMSQHGDPGDEKARQALITSLLKGQPNAEERAEKLAVMTAGMDEREIRQLVNPDADPVIELSDDDPLKDVLQYIQVRKKQLIEQSCYGLLEFVDSKHDLDAVGGLDGIKDELRAIAREVRTGKAASIPKGIMLVGAMGSGKTFVAKCFARSAGIPAVVLRNVRDRWVGSTEANLERVLDTIQALGPIILIVDEADRAFGSGGSESDGGTSSRVIARMKAFMSDSVNRGRVLFVLMTNRPDKMDVDMKRAGRIDRKIPLFYPSTVDDVTSIVNALAKRYGINMPDVPTCLMEKLVGRSIADIEEVLLLAARMSDGKTAGPGELSRAIEEYRGAFDVDMIRYMELLAVQEASRQSMLPAKYAGMDPDEITNKVIGVRQRLVALNKV